jgi:uncharacterized protein (DUF302 family)
LTAAEFDKIQALITSERKAIVIYQKRSKHSPQEVEQSLREAVQRHKFGILHVLDLKSTLQDKGIELDNEVRIYDVCNPLAASQALRQDLATATVLPCRIAVYSNAEGSTIATVKPTDLFAATGLRHADTLAQDVEREIIAIIDEAVA